MIRSKPTFDRRIIPKDEIVEHGHQSGLAHPYPQKIPAHQSSAHENACREETKETLTSTTDEDEVVVYARDPVL